MFYDIKDYNSAMSDLNRVLKDEPGNALTLYNRSLINAQVGNYEEALSDMDRVININPNNVLAYFNRASYFIEMERWQDALEDYDRAIELYPDFAKAYMNRSYVKNMMGQVSESKEDYRTAQRKVSEYRAANASDQGSFADTTKKYSSLLALDADFAKKDFDNELLQHRDIDIHLKPLYKFSLSGDRNTTTYALQHRYENALMDKFINDSPVTMTIAGGNNDTLVVKDSLIDALMKGGDGITTSKAEFIRALYSIHNKQFNSALSSYDRAIEEAGNDVVKDSYSDYYKAFYLLNRGVLRADMIEFIASIQNNVQTLTMDDQKTTRARVGDQVTQSYDYSEAIDDLLKASEILPDLPYVHFNLGNLYCLSSQLITAMESYDKAISLHPYMGDAYFNRGLVLIYLKDKEKGCIDLSRAGELGVADSYSVIAKYCEDEQ